MMNMHTLNVKVSFVESRTGTCCGCTADNDSQYSDLASGTQHDTNENVRIAQALACNCPS